MLAIDVNVTGTTTNNLGSITSPSFTTVAGNELLLAFVCCGGSAVQGIASVTGAGLAWVNQVDAHASGTGGTSATVWSAWTSSKLTSQTVTATSSGTNNDMFINVISLQGADSNGVSGSGAIGATNTNSFSSAAPSITVTTTRANSWVFAVGTDGTINTSVTAGSNQTIINRVADTGDFVSFWCQRQNLLTAKVGTVVTMNDTAPTTDAGNFGALEILPAMPSFKPNNLRPHPFSPGLSR